MIWCIRPFARACVCAYVRACACACLCACVYARSRVCVCVCVCVSGRGRVSRAVRGRQTRALTRVCDCSYVGGGLAGLVGVAGFAIQMDTSIELVSACLCVFAARESVCVTARVSVYGCR